MGEPINKVLAEIAVQIPGEFEVTEFLGEGGHGIVLKALHRTLMTTVAIKIIKDDGSQEAVKQFKRMQNEARALAKLSHKNIVRVHQLGSCKDGTPFLVCEYLEGVTLAQYLSSKERLNPREILQIFPQILDALTFAHSNQLLHRDLKPSNVMILKDEETDDLLVKLLDFGIARDFESAENAPLGLTRTIQISGSAPYMSPEQCKGEPIDVRADIYSIACMLYECLAGAPPFRGDTPVHTRYMQIHEEASLPRDDKYALTSSRSAIYKVALRGLAKRREERFPNAQEFKAELIKALPGAQRRLSWSTSKRDWKPIVVPLLLFCLLAGVAGASILALKLAGNNQLPKSQEKTSNKLSVHSKMMRLSHLVDDNKHFPGGTDAAALQRAAALRDQVCELIAGLKPEEKALAYVAWQTKANIERKVRWDKDSIKSWLRVLTLTRDNKGRLTTEACEACSTLAIDYFDLGDYNTARDYAEQGLSLAEEQKKNTIILDLPPELDARLGLCQQDLLAIRANIAIKEKNFDLAEKDYREAEKIERESKSIAESTQLLVHLANVLEMKGQLKKALDLLDQRDQKLLEFGKLDTERKPDNVLYAYRCLLEAEYLPVELRKRIEKHLAFFKARS